MLCVCVLTILDAIMTLTHSCMRSPSPFNWLDRYKMLKLVVTVLPVAYLGFYFPTTRLNRKIDGATTAHKIIFEDSPLKHTKMKLGYNFN